MPAPWENKIRVFKHWLFGGHIIRKIKISSYFKRHKIRKIQIASGELPVKEEGWLTADIYTGDIYLDATKKLPFPDNSIDIIFNEHFLEHLPYNKLFVFLNECYRVLKPGGKLWISMPDFGKIMKICVEKDEHFLKEFTKLLKKITPENGGSWKGREMITPAEFLLIQTFGFRHYSPLDFDTLKMILECVGFTKVREIKDKNHKIKKLKRHQEVDPLNELYIMDVEAIKPKQKKECKHDIKSTMEYFLKKLRYKG